MEKTRFPLVLGVLPLLGLYGCDIGSDETLVTSSGIVNKGILSNAIAHAYQADNGALVKSVYTAVDGTFSLGEINFDGTLYIEVKTTSQTLATCDGASGCGDFPNGLKQAGEFDNNLNGRIDFGDKYFFNDEAFKLTAYIKPASSNGARLENFAVTPLTHLAAEKISKIQNANPDQIEIINAQVAELFGLNGTDITRVIPPDITSEDAMLNADPSQQLYAALNAAVASSATSNNTSVASVINTLATGFVNDGGLVGNSADEQKVTLASLQSLAKDVTYKVQQEFPNINLSEVAAQIEEEIAEQLAKPADEIVVPSQDPLLHADFDGDGLSDDDERDIYHTDPFNPDSDGDGLPDGEEIQIGTMPDNSDTDGDGLPDGWEVTFNLPPLSKSDQTDDDNDGLTNIEEFTYGSNPNSTDTDGDTLDDFAEVMTHNTLPGHVDTDLDSINDNIEITKGSNPLVANPIIEFVSDAQVYTNQTTGTLEFAVSADQSTIVTTGGLVDTGDLDIIDSVTDTNGVADVLFHGYGTTPDTADLPIRQESDSSALPTGNSKFIDISADNTHTVYSSNATDIIAVDANAQEDLFVFNRGLKDSIRMEKNGTEPTGGVTDYGVISGNNQFVLLTSTATNLTSNDTNASSDVFLNDLHISGNTNITLISRNYLSNDTANNDSFASSISSDGNRIAFVSRATNIIDNSITDNNGALIDVYLYDALTDSHFRISKHKNTAQDDTGADAAWVKISANGKGMVYQTPRDILDLNTGGAGANYNQIFYVDVDQVIAGTSVEEYTTLVTSSYDGSNFGYSDDHADGANLEITADGERVIYRSPAVNIISTGNNAASIEDIYVWDRSTAQNHRLSQFVYGTEADGSLGYDDNPGSNHINGMGVVDFSLSQDGNAVYAMLNYGDEYTDSPAGCSGALYYCLYRIKIPTVTLDSDNDGLSDVQELAISSSINNPDTDSDGLKDGIEIFQYKTSPIQADTDGDGTNDNHEIINGTDPLDPSVP